MMLSYTSSGEVVFAATIRKDKVDKKDKEDHFQYKVFVISKSGMKEGDFYVDGEMVNNSAKLLYISENDVVIGGDYVNKNNKEGSNGSYAVEFELSTCKAINKAAFAFTPSTFDSVSYKGDGASLKGIPDLHVVNLLNNGNDGFVIVFDCNTSGVASFRDVSSGRTGPQVSQYESDDKLIIGFDKSLKRKFETVIKAGFASSTKNTDISSYCIGDKTILVYSEGHSKGWYRCYATLIDKDGKVVLSKMLNPELSGYEFRASLSRQLSANSIILNFAPCNMSGMYTETKFREAVVSIK